MKSQVLLWPGILLPLPLPSLEAASGKVASVKGSESPAGMVLNAITQQGSEASLEDRNRSQKQTGICKARLPSSHHTLESGQERDLTGMCMSTGCEVRNHQTAGYLGKAEW